MEAMIVGMVENLNNIVFSIFHGIQLTLYVFVKSLGIVQDAAFLLKKQIHEDAKSALLQLILAQ